MASVPQPKQQPTIRTITARITIRLFLAGSLIEVKSSLIVTVSSAGGGVVYSVYSSLVA